MAEPAKYIFDRSFETGAGHHRTLEALVEQRLRADFERQLDEARRAAHAEGLAEGERAARQSIDGQLAETVAALTHGLQGLSEEMQSHCARCHEHAVELAATAAGKLAGELVARAPVGLLETFFANCLEHIADAPHIVIRINDGLVEAAEPRFAALAQSHGLAGKLALHGDPGLAMGDCRIEWADGGIARNAAEVGDALERKIEAYLETVRGGAAHPAANGSGETQ